ncbi:hypothetical protein [Microterricola viridarii]|uniref:Uncharacterized protein n=1 Tax=Microterricola viridarii TaxID=412690 RepID=A0A1H1XAD7_9MICO|nr:hypothetical protein [Microterricola viridarii]SDT06254.1 hypothetical protein SAMN04489834_2741 [Microterricola viridarii]
MISRRGLACVVATVLLLAGASGCSAQPPAGAWLISATPANDERNGPPDITYGNGLITDDTEGGTWYVSVGSWLRSSSTGAVTRFNIERWQGRHELDIAALSPTRILVLLSLGRNALSTEIELFDTETRQSEPFLVGQRTQTSPDAPLPFTADGPVNAASPLGQITSIDVDAAGALVFVERVNVGQAANDEYIVRRMLPGGEVETVAGVPVRAEGQAAVEQPGDGEQLRGSALAAASVDVSAGDPRGIVLGTEHGVFQILEDGTARVVAGALDEASPLRAALEPGNVDNVRVRPVDASADGRIVYHLDDIGQPAGHLVTPAAHIDGGSAEFRELVQGTPARASGTGLAIWQGNAPLAVSPALQNARTAAWVAPGVLVAVVGGGQDNAALPRVQLTTVR